jgi:Ca2+:H+ antiporter
LGIVVVPVIGNIAEYTSSVLMALRNKINISIEIAIGSSMQMALFVTPILVLMSMVFKNPMSYAFTSFGLITIACSIGLSLYIFQDGKTNWLEGVELISAYIIIALAYFFMR